MDNRFRLTQSQIVRLVSETTNLINPISNTSNQSTSPFVKYFSTKVIPTVAESLRSVGVASAAIRLENIAS